MEIDSLMRTAIPCFGRELDDAFFCVRAKVSIELFELVASPLVFRMSDRNSKSTSSECGVKRLWMRLLHFWNFNALSSKYLLQALYIK